MTEKPFDTIKDFITGKEIPNIGAEENRQSVEKFLVTEKGYAKEEIETDVKIEITVTGETYTSKTDLVIQVNRIRFMVIKCVAGSIGSWEREILSAARLLDSYQIPFAAVSDGKTAMVLDTVSGKQTGEGLNAIPDAAEAKEQLKNLTLQPFPKERLEREKIIFRSYDSMSVNRA